MSTALAIRPQPKQIEFLSSPADFCIYGGAAGSGKSYALLLEGTRHIDVPTFTPVILRRTMADIRKQGGIWDESENIYPHLYAKPTPSALKWTFPGGMKLKFSHIEHEKDLDSWRSASLGMIGFEEITQFTEKQIWYMFSRNRSASGIRPYIRGTTNPDPDHMVRRLIDWWIDDHGDPIPERSGILRYFTKDGDNVIWGERPEDVMEKVKDLKWNEVKSFTFIPAKITDNPALLNVDPGYIGNLKALGTVERGQLLDGNWDIRPAAGLYFKRKWLDGKMVDIGDLPEDMKICRGWDFAATEESENKRADRTAKFLLGVSGKGRNRQYWVMHADAYRASPFKVEQDLLKTAQNDGTHVHIRIPQDPGQAGKSQARGMISLLAGYKIRKKPPTGKKTTRFSPFSAQMEAGNVHFVRGHWNEMVFKEFEQFSGSPKDVDDIVDAASDAFDLLSPLREFTAY